MRYASRRGRTAGFEMPVLLGLMPSLMLRAGMVGIGRKYTRTLFQFARVDNGAYHECERPPPSGGGLFISRLPDSL